MLCVACPAFGQTFSSADYASLVRTYRNDGDPGAVAALNALAGWPRQPLSKAVAVASGNLTGRELVAAAVLHTELANAVADRRPQDAAYHLEKARDLLRTLERQPNPEGVADVKRNLYVFVIGMYVSLQATSQASWWAREGLQQFPRDAQLYVARGAINEGQVQQLVLDLRRDSTPDARTQTRADTLLKAAVLDYERALSIDRRLAVAHLHVGWTRLFLRDRRAREPLEQAIAASDNDSELYLGHLFLGGAHEQAGRIEDARREYEAAVAAGPGYQTGYVALGRTEEALGHAARARELAAVCAQLVKVTDDPWWAYRIGFDRAALLRLRAAARR